MTSTRIVAAMVGLAIVLPAVFLAGPLGVQLVAAFALLVAADEWSRMAFPDDQRFAFLWLVVGIGALVGASMLDDPAVLTAAVGMLTVLTMMQVTLRPGPELAAAANRVGRYMVGFAWLPLIWFLVHLRGFDNGVWFVILALAISWLGDTGAYFAGRQFGKRKMYPRVSPKKTWEGLIGGVITAVIGVIAMRALVLPELTLVDAVVLGAVGCLAGVLGDLAESLMKRAFDVKDSGWILPGHGGMLDRVDSVLFVAPTVWSYLVLVRGM